RGEPSACGSSYPGHGGQMAIAKRSPRLFGGLFRRRTLRTMQGPHVEDKLPALHFWQAAEGRHTPIRVAVGQLPEKGSVTLRLHLRQQKVRRFLFRQPASIRSVTLDTVPLEKFFPAGRRFRLLSQRIGP